MLAVGVSKEAVDLRVEETHVAEAVEMAAKRVDAVDRRQDVADAPTAVAHEAHHQPAPAVQPRELCAGFAVPRATLTSILVVLIARRHRNRLSCALRLQRRVRERLLLAPRVPRRCHGWV